MDAQTWSTAIDCAPVPVAVAVRDGAVRLTRPVHRIWTLRAGDTVLLASTRLADRLVHADGPCIEALLDAGFAPDLVRALPDPDEPARWTERQFSAAVIRC